MCGILAEGTPQVGRRWDAGGTQVGRRWDAGGTQEKINSSERICRGCSNS